ncbi:MAG: hypothetical protein ABWZ40_01270 [Caulobacterales bacterium]
MNVGKSVLPTDDDELKGFKHWADLINKRGQAGFFARGTPEEKAIVERHTAGEWALSMRAEYGVNIEKIRSADVDPPDCFATFGDRTISIELAELVNGRVLDSISRSRRGRKVSSAVSFDELQWTPERFHSRLGGLLDKKQLRYAARKLAIIDAFVIFTDELWLSPDQAEKWLALETVVPRDFCRSAFLLMSYRPGDKQHWPVFKLFGEFGST